jgi:hypothetical protein
LAAQLLHSPAYYAVLGLLCGIVGFRLGWRARNRYVLPLIQGLLGFVAFATAWRMVGPLVAALAVGGWALGSGLAAIPTFRKLPHDANRCVLGATRYREEMLAWLQTGRGPESRPLATARAHVVELVVYLAAALASANLLSIVIGAALLNRMNAYVAVLLTAARRPWAVRLLGWNVWSLIRVAAYVLLGSACAAPLADRAGFPARRDSLLMPVLLGGGGVVVDFLLKLILSRPCGRVLSAALQWEALARSGPSGVAAGKNPGG